MISLTKFATSNGLAKSTVSRIAKKLNINAPFSEDDCNRILVALNKKPVVTQEEEILIPELVEEEYSIAPYVNPTKTVAIVPTTNPVVESYQSDLTVYDTSEHQEAIGLNLESIFDSFNNLGNGLIAQMEKQAERDAILALHTYSETVAKKVAQGLNQSKK